MSVPGWYSDPGKAPGRFRYWDGTAWSQVTTANPGDPPPATPGAPRPPRRRRAGLIGAAALLVVLALLAVVVARYVGNHTVTVADSGPSAPPSRVDDGSAAPSPTPGPVETAVAPTAAPSEVCPLGDPTARQDHPADGRVHGGGLSFPAQAGWDRSDLTRQLTWAYDVGGQEEAVEPQWNAVFAVGALSTVDGFEAPESAAAMAMNCTATSEVYPGFTDRDDLDAEAVTVAGHPGWRIRSEIHVANDRTTLPGDVVEIIVVDLDSPESLAMFWGAVPIGDQALIDQLDQVTQQLEAD